MAPIEKERIRLDMYGGARPLLWDISVIVTDTICFDFSDATVGWFSR